MTEFSLPAVLGGAPAFPDGLPIARPSTPDIEVLLGDFRDIFASGRLTSGGFVRALENEVASYLGVAHCVAVSSCTAGLMLVLQAVGARNKVIVPSFTFAATAHAAKWNGLGVTWADIDAETLTLDPRDVERRMGDDVSAVMATHTFGTPCDVDELDKLAEARGVPMIYDAAHALGSRRGKLAIGGFGRAEVFSLSPTKSVTACEGGIVATGDDRLAELVRIGRDYGNPGDYNCDFAGLSARLSEIHAAIALRNLVTLDARLARRNQLAGIYHTALAKVPGLSFPHPREGDTSTYKDYVVLVDAEVFGIDADSLARALDADGIETRRYYTPPVHLTNAYRDEIAEPETLSVTEWAAGQSLTLPLWEAMPDDAPNRVADVIATIQLSASKGRIA